jgi:hypothetical protein
MENDKGEIVDLYVPRIRARILHSSLTVCSPHGRLQDAPEMP